MFSQTQEGRSVLHSSAELDLPSTAEFLVGESVGADADILSADGYRPLFIAAVLGHIGTARVLVEEGGADVEARQGGKLTTFLADMMRI